MAKPVRVRTSTGWQDLAVPGPPGPPGGMEVYEQAADPDIALDPDAGVGAIWIDTDAPDPEPAGSPPIHVKSYGAAMDGTADDTAEINAATAAAQAAGGGVVNLGAGTALVSDSLILREGVYIRGEGPGATTIKLANGANKDVLKTENFDTLVGTNANAGPIRFGFSDLTIDGNKDNNTSGRGVAIYGRQYEAMRFVIRNTAGEGYFSEWYSGGDEMECQIAHFKIYRSRSHGFHYRGPHDSVVQDGQVIAAGHSGGAGVRSIWMDAGAAAGTQLVAVHTWGLEHARAWYVTTAGTQMIACQGEGASETQLFLDAQDVVVMGGHFFGTGDGDASTALVVGDTASGGYPAKNLVQTKLSGAGTLVDFQREGGRSVYRLVCAPITGGDVMVGTPNSADLVELTVDSDTAAADSLHLGLGPVSHRLPNLDNAIQVVRDVDEVNLIELDTQADPTIKFRGMWYEAVDYGGTPAWEIAPDGAAIFTKARPIYFESGGIALTTGSDISAPPSGFGVTIYQRAHPSTGKQQLMAKFPTGAPQQLAIEP